MSWIQNTLHQSVSLIKAHFSGKEDFYGTGFFYSDMLDENVTKKGWIEIENEYFITAKHCLYYYDIEKYEEILCDQLTIDFVLNIEEKIVKQSISIEKSLLQENLLKHEDEEIDIIIINIGNIKRNLFEKEKQIELLHNKAISRNKLPKFNEMIEIETTSEIIVYGYPYGYFDNHNLFPLCKSGIIASGWGLNFDDEPKFKIDVQLFPVSSGSPVILMPIDHMVRNNQILVSNIKNLVLLGVYTGEYQRKVEEKIEIIETGKEISIKREQSLGFGNVYYSFLIDEIISNNRQKKEKSL